jgi:lipopolysaccharide export system permease protein
LENKHQSRKATALLNLLQRHLLRQILLALGFATGAVTIVVLFTQSFRLLALVIDNAAGLWAFLSMALLFIPSFLGLILPIGLALAILFVIQKLTADLELTIMQAAGMSLPDLAKPVMILAGMVMLLVLALNLWVAPWANRALVAKQYQIRNEFSVYLLRPGVFNDIGKGLTFYARRRDHRGGLENILIHDNRQPEKPVTVMAERGQVVMLENEPRIVVFNGQRQEFDRASQKMTTLDFTRYAFDLTLLRGSNDRLPDPRELTLKELLSDAPVAIKRSGGRDRLLAELHQRLGGALATLGFAMLALILLLEKEFNRRGMALRLVVTVLAIVGFQAGLMWLSNLLARDLVFALPFYGAAIAPAVYGVWRLRCSNRIGAATVAGGA